MKAGRVVADAGPLHYLALIGDFDLLGKIFDEVIVPDAVRKELLHKNAPTVVSIWFQRNPAWLKFTVLSNVPISSLHPGEREVIYAATSMKINAVLIDERHGRRAATQAGLTAIGTVGFLEMASVLELIDFESAIRRLQNTNAFISAGVIQEAIKRNRARKRINPEG
jgi:predicted nucleic acid-binding protein